VASIHLLSLLFLTELTFSTLKMEAICSSETSVGSQRTTRRYIPEGGTVQYYRCENLKLLHDLTDFALVCVNCDNVSLAEFS
jgi:hypothetical protein